MTVAGIRTIVIVGGGTAGWMAAAMLSQFAGENVTITLVESDSIGTVGVGEATIPQIHHFNAALGINEAEFVSATNGSFKLGIEFVDWARPGHRYMHAFGQVGRGLGFVPFHHYWLRHLGKGGQSALADYSPCAIAGWENRFAPAADAPGRLPSGVSYAYQFDAALYAAFLRRYAEARGVVRTEGRIVDVAQDPLDGSVASVRLENGDSISGDLFIDCSGFRGLLIEGALKAGYEDWSHWLPCNRAMAVPCESVSPLTPYTRSTARDAGWQWRIPLQHRTGNGYVYCSDYISDDEAAAKLLANLDGAPLGDPRPLRFTSGKRKRAWVKNVVALGLASGFMEPLESTSIHLVQAGIARLIELFPHGAFAEADIAEFNRQTDFEWEAIRDFIALHYHMTERQGPLWDRTRQMDLPTGLARKLALFRSGGRIVREHEELFTEVGWLQVLIGQGVMPTAYHPFANQLSDADLDEFLSLARRHARGVASAMPDHSAFIARHCASPSLPQKAAA
jgi:tryptophan 7-halogenase